jgi:hypothetical protein
MYKFILITLLIPASLFASNLSFHLADEAHLTYQAISLKNEGMAFESLSTLNVAQLPQGIESCTANSTCHIRYQNTCTPTTVLAPQANCLLWFHAKNSNYFAQPLEKIVTITVGEQRTRFRFRASSQLFVAGNFTKPGDLIARWDGKKWYPLGNGLTGESALSLVEYKGDLVAGGDFYMAGETPVDFMARWNGKQWDPVHDGIGDPGPNTLAVYADTLFAGGGFGEVDHSVEAHYLASFFDERWSGYETYLNDPITTLVANGSALYAGGDFIEPVNHIGLWQYSHFEPLGAGLNGVVSILTTTPNQGIYAGGRFTASGQQPLNHIAQWDGQQWLALKDGLNDEVMALATYHDVLYAGGLFTASGKQSLHKIAQWNGHKWQPLAGGVAYEPNPKFSQIRSIFSLQDAVFVGGYFTQAINETHPVNANYVAQWHTKSKTWSALGNGVNGLVHSVLVMPVLEIAPVI